MEMHIMKGLMMLNNPIALWESNKGLVLDNPDITQVNEILPFNKKLFPKEVQHIETAFDNRLFDMALEYTWTRTYNVIKENVLSFGDDFVLDMLGKTNKSSVDTISPVEYIRLATDLGIINEIAKKRFLHLIDLIEYFSSRESDGEEITYMDALLNITICVQYVLSYDSEGFNIAFNDFRNNLKLEALSEVEIEQIKISPYFYKKTTVRTLLNLLNETKGAEADKVFENMTKIIPEIWLDLLSDDRYPLGFSYAEAVNEGSEFKTKALKTVLLKVNGFDYVPENLRSLSFIDSANKLIEIHYGFNNYYKEPAQASLLNSLGTIIPGPAISICVRASLICIMGNRYGKSEAAQTELFKILDKLTPEKWTSYFNTSFTGDEDVLYKLFEGTSMMQTQFQNVVKRYKLTDLILKNSQVEKLLKYSLDGQFNDVKRVAKTLYDANRTNTPN